MIEPLLLSLRVALVALLFALPVGVLLAWWLSRARPGVRRTLAETLVSLPLVLPPSAVGVALLLLLGRGSALGRFLVDRLHIQLAFAWGGAAVASAVVALPLIVRAAEAGLSAVDGDLRDAARTEGATEWQTICAVTLPLAYRAVLAGATLGFARAFGEFGATLIVAGAIPGETETVPLALWNAIERGDSGAAVRFACLAAAVSFALLFVAGRFGASVARGRGERI